MPRKETDREIKPSELLEISNEILEETRSTPQDEEFLSVVPVSPSHVKAFWHIHEEAPEMSLQFQNETSQKDISIPVNGIDNSWDVHLDQPNSSYKASLFSENENENLVQSANFKTEAIPTQSRHLSEYNVETETFSDSPFYILEQSFEEEFSHPVSHKEWDLYDYAMEKLYEIMNGSSSEDEERPLKSTPQSIAEKLNNLRINESIYSTSLNNNCTLPTVVRTHHNERTGLYEKLEEDIQESSTSSSFYSESETQYPGITLLAKGQLKEDISELYYANTPVHRLPFLKFEVELAPSNILISEILDGIANESRSESTIPEYLENISFSAIINPAFFDPSNNGIPFHTLEFPLSTTSKLLAGLSL